MNLHELRVPLLYYAEIWLAFANREEEPVLGGFVETENCFLHTNRCSLCRQTAGSAFQLPSVSTLFPVAPVVRRLFGSVNHSLPLTTNLYS